MPTTESAGEGDDDGQPGEDDGGARGTDGAAGRLVRSWPPRVAPVAGDDEQRVVDADGQPQHQREDRVVLDISTTWPKQ